MKKPIFKLEKRIESTDIDLNLNVKLSYLFLYFQEVAGQHADAIGIGRNNVTEKGLHWVITRFNVEINRMPRYGEEISIETYPGDNNKFFFYRYFMVKDKKGNFLVKASSIWLIVNPQNGLPVKDPFPNMNIPVHHEADELNLPEKVEIDVGEQIYQKTIRYSDIDLNAHLNNTRYIELIQDSFDIDFYRQQKIKSITINYLSELRMGDEVTIYRQGNNPYTIVGKKGEKAHFVAKLTF